MSVKSGDTVPIEALAKLASGSVTRMFLEQIKAEWPGWPLPVLEHRFAPPRRWKFDLAWPGRVPPVAVEIDGGTWLPGGGRHNRAKGFQNDMEKLNRAAAMSWMVLRFTPDQIRNGTALNELRGVLQ